MNGRAFDYHLGRFTGVDPFIQFPLNSQSLNPYSYILNNPLSGTDPTGYQSRGSVCAIGTSGNANGCISGAGSDIPTGTEKINKPGNPSENDRGKHPTTNSGNGGGNTQGTTGSGGRKDQAANASEKNASINSLSSAESGNGGLHEIEDGLYSLLKVNRDGESGSGASDFTDAPEPLRKMLGDTEKREDAVRLLVGNLGYDDIDTDNVRVSADPYIRRSAAGGFIYDRDVLGSVDNETGELILYPTAFEYGYYGLASVIDHEVIHVRQFVSLGSFKNANERSLREFEAYKYQAGRNNFRMASYTFRRYQIAGWYGEIDKFRKNNDLWEDDGCGVNATCVGYQ